MKKTWLDKLCEPLEHPKYPQIKGALVQKDESGHIVGKCAEGEIACQNHIKFSPLQSYLLANQLTKLGIPEDLVWDLPLLWVNGPQFDPVYESDGIGEYIYKLNDSGFTYKQIIEFLKTTFGDAV